MKDLVSIIIPVYQVEKYLDRCLLCVTNQTYRNIEIILVDDGSIDNSGKMCDLWAKKDNRIKVIHQKNKGLSGARNTGIKEANGDFIIAIDSDDYIVINAIELLINSIKTTNADVAIFKFRTTFKQSGLKKLPIDNKSLEYFILENEKIHEQIFFSLDYQTFFWNKLYRAEILKNNYLDENLFCYEDIESLPRILKDCKKAVFLKNYLLYYLIRINSLSHNPDKIEYRLNNLLAICELNIKRYNKWYPELGLNMHHYLSLQYILFSHDIFTKLRLKEKKNLLFSEKYLSIYYKYSIDFMKSPYTWYVKLLFLRLKIRLYFNK